MLDTDDTIAAIASPPGPAVRGIVRLSGPRALPIAQERFTPDDPAPWPDRAASRAGRVAVAGLRTPVPARLIAWPRSSYTGQPASEIHTTGSRPILEALLADCLARGARLAEPGEFTLRAFLSGRIDLTRAEAVLGVIEARSRAQLDSALEQLAGGIAGPIGLLRDRILDVLAHLEAGLDFADESDVDPLAQALLAKELSAAADEVRSIGERLSGRDRDNSRPRVLLFGPPNAGKSGLFNALVGQGRALVSPEPGTTRDYLSAECDCDGLTVELIDTAGVESARDAIEVQAQAARDRMAALADLMLVCDPADGTGPAREPADRPHLRVRTKCDLLPCPASPDVLTTSARTGAGLDTLRATIAATLRRSARESAVAGTTARCRESLMRAGENLQSAARALTLGGGEEVVAIDLRQALDDLGRVVGAVVTDDILDRIFSRFCIGK